MPLSDYSTRVASLHCCHGLVDHCLQGSVLHCLRLLSAVWDESSGPRRQSPVMSHVRWDSA